MDAVPYNWTGRLDKPASASVKFAAPFQVRDLNASVDRSAVYPTPVAEYPRNDAAVFANFARLQPLATTGACACLKTDCLQDDTKKSFK